MFKKSVQQGRSERRGESYFVPYVEPLSDARTMLAGFFNNLPSIFAAWDQLCHIYQQFRLSAARQYSTIHWENTQAVATTPWHCDCYH